jgi:hypothetical protein
MLVEDLVFQMHGDADFPQRAIFLEIERISAGVKPDFPFPEMV